MADWLLGVAVSAEFGDKGNVCEGRQRHTACMVWAGCGEEVLWWCACGNVCNSGRVQQSGEAALHWQWSLYLIIEIDSKQSSKQSSKRKGETREKKQKKRNKRKTRETKEKKQEKIYRVGE